mmetsp:Transcript_18233/g.73043  ORF Transcript_18233/g.73043 Transcript_18233/m.73043 type:complete len:215 (-) Transcript_18233:3544-4188(-)
MMLCNPARFREELQNDHNFQVYLRKKGIRWFGYGIAKPLSSKQKLLKRRLDSKRTQAYRLSYYERAENIAKVTKFGKRSKAAEELNPKERWKRKDSPSKLKAKKSSAKRVFVNCTCGIDVFTGECLQCELCNKWSHRPCTGISDASFDKIRTRKLGSVFICYQCSLQAEAWTDLKVAVVSSRIERDFDTNLEALKKNASEAERPLLQQDYMSQY